MKRVSPLPASHCSKSAFFISNIRNRQVSVRCETHSSSDFDSMMARSYEHRYKTCNRFAVHSYGSAWFDTIQALKVRGALLPDNYSARNYASLPVHPLSYLSRLIRQHTASHMIASLVLQMWICSFLPLEGFECYQPFAGSACLAQGNYHFEFVYLSFHFAASIGMG